MDIVTANTDMKVFVHLAYGFGAKSWNDRFRNGKIIGINEPFAYGYHRAREFGCNIEYSEDKVESFLEKYFRLGLRFFLKFDFIHAWRNRHGICTADVVWTHTESQHAAVLLLFSITRRRARPKLIAQSVWLYDRWFKMPLPNRWLFRRLLARADILTVLSSENLKLARKLFPDIRSELVLYGINVDGMISPPLRQPHHPIRLVSLGNDEHRDWETLIAAVENLSRCELRIASKNVDPGLYANAKNISVVRPKSNDELLALYDWADIAIVTLKPNLHASGITVLQEATLRGLPAICSDIPGLREYFADDEVIYVPPHDVEAIRRVVMDVAGDDDLRRASVKRAQARISPDGLSSQSYVKKHVELSNELLGRASSGKVGRF